MTVKKERLTGSTMAALEKKVKREKRPAPTVAATIETVDLTEDADDEDCMIYRVAKRPKAEAALLHLD
jgi:hypothetical protein